MPLIREEVTRVASSAYDDSGNSLYDAIIIKSRDEATLNRMYRDAVSALVARTSDIARYDMGEDGEDNLSFYVPDIDTSTLPLVTQEIIRHISLNIVGAWLQEKYTDAAEGYIARGQLALDKVIRMLKTRKKPTRI